MSEAPPFDEMLRHALPRLDQDDVRIFYDYFDELKAQVRKYLGSKAKVLPGAVRGRSEFVAACEALYAQLSPEEQAVLEGRLKDETLEQIAQRINRSQTTVSNRLTRIRDLLETL